MPLVVSEDAPEHVPSRDDDLGGDVDEALQEGAELHGEQAPLLHVVALAPAGVTGNKKAHQALRLQAMEAMVIYAQLAFKVLTGACKARTSDFNCAMRFSWLQRWRAWPTTSSGSWPTRW